jgi:hypothetical protein
MNECSLSNAHCLGEKVFSMPRLDVVIHYDVYSPILELTYKCGNFRHRFLVKRSITLRLFCLFIMRIF